MGMLPLISQAAEIYNKDGNRVYLDGSFKVRHYFSSDNHVAGDQSKVKFRAYPNRILFQTMMPQAKCNMAS